MRVWGAEHVGSRGAFWMLVCVHLEEETCFKPARATSLEVGKAGLQKRGNGEVQTLPLLN